jgi:putative membrane protein
MWMALAIAAMYGGVGILLSIIGYFLFDLMERRIDFAGEIKKGNVAAAIVIAAVVIGICFIVGRAVGS